MTKQYCSQTELHKKILEGVDILADNVASTLGPRGRNVILWTTAVGNLVWEINHRGQAIDRRSWEMDPNRLKHIKTRQTHTKETKKKTNTHSPNIKTNDVILFLFLVHFRQP